MRAEERNKTSGVYCTEPFSLWTRPRVEKIKQKACIASFVFLLLQRRGGGNWEREQGGGGGGEKETKRCRTGHTDH